MPSVCCIIDGVSDEDRHGFIIRHVSDAILLKRREHGASIMPHIALMAPALPQHYLSSLQARGDLMPLHISAFALDNPPTLLEVMKPEHHDDLMADKRFGVVIIDGASWERPIEAHAAEVFATCIAKWMATGRFLIYVVCTAYTQIHPCLLAHMTTFVHHYQAIGSTAKQIQIDVVPPGAPDEPPCSVRTVVPPITTTAAAATPTLSNKMAQASMEDLD